MKPSMPRRIGVPPKPPKSAFVTELKASAEVWDAERMARDEELPDFLQMNNPAGEKPPVPASHSLNIRQRPGVRR